MKEKSLLETIPPWLRNLHISVETSKHIHLFDTFVDNIKDLIFGDDLGIAVDTIIFVKGEKYIVTDVQIYINDRTDKNLQILSPEIQPSLGIQIMCIVEKHD